MRILQNWRLNLRRYQSLYSSRPAAMIIAVLLVLIGTLRIASTFKVLSQAFDEPAHVACGMEWLDKGTYTLEPLHPPLARVASAIGPFLAGLRLPPVAIIQDEQGRSYDIYGAGNNILYAGGHYRSNLALSRVGMLPFFSVAAFVVFFWARSLFGDWPATVAVYTFTTVPPVLAFAGLAYTDFPLACFVAAALFTFTRWLEIPSVRRSLVLGFFTGLAVLSKLTCLLFLPPCILVIIACRLSFDRQVDGPAAPRYRLLVPLCLTLLTVGFVIWGGYRFSVRPLDNVIERPIQDIGSLKGIPSPLKRLAITIVEANPPLPAPALFKGIVADWERNHSAPPSYLLGKTRQSGWWYFFVVALGVKTPLAFLTLSVIGIACILGSTRGQRHWRVLAPALSALVILAITMPVKVNIGIRHILVIYPLLAVVTASAAKRLWETTRWPTFAPMVLSSLLIWQAVSSVHAHPDYLSYFNELAGSKPEEILLLGCDLDCGQDVLRLSQTLRQQGVRDVALRIFTSADLGRMELPLFRQLAPHQPASGWVAVSIRGIRTGNVLQDIVPPDGYSWLDSYKPAALVGKTIRLYYIPESLQRLETMHKNRADPPRSK